jgi:mRNA-degrading endonuclease RelE of RelBE toxin-antitoxin system
MFQVLVSRTFQKQFDSLSNDMKKRIRKGMRELERDPINPRSGADIKPLQDTDPPKHRLRIGEYRLVYYFNGTKVMLIELFVRGRGYREIS